MVQHSNREYGLSHVVYVGTDFNDYCAVGGSTLYKGASDLEVSLPGPVSHLQSFVSSSSEYMLAAGLKTTG
jgi:hypothetical protein